MTNPIKKQKKDYRIPQMLHQLNCLMYSPPLESHIRQLKPLPSGSTWEVELRGTSIWCVELIRQEIERRHPETKIISTHDDDDNMELDHEYSFHEEAEKNGKVVTDMKTRKKKGKDKGKNAGLGVNAILIDFFLYDTMKELEREGQETIPHHRTRSIWY